MWKNWILGLSIMLNFLLFTLWWKGRSSEPQVLGDTVSSQVIDLADEGQQPIFEEEPENIQSKPSLLSSKNEEEKPTAPKTIDTKHNEKLNIRSTDSLVSRLEGGSPAPVESNATNASQGMLEFQNVKGYIIQYAGSIQNDQANGKGIGVWNTGSYYKGEWKNGMRHGFGLHTWVDGERYEGSYVYDKREGYGTYRWKNGESYSGAWKNDRRHGFGVLKNKKGAIKKEGIWENDEFVKAADE